MVVAFPHRPGAGGPGVFQERIEDQFSALGWRIAYLTDDIGRPDVVFVVGGTRKIAHLFKLKCLGVPILYRLDGIPWIHRKRWPGLTQFMRSEIQSVILKITHGLIADHVVYQSEFVRHWWERSGWRTAASSSVIRNGVDLQQFTPRRQNIERSRHSEKRRVICVEGHLDYTPYAIGLVNDLASRLRLRGVSIHLFGGVAHEQSLISLEENVSYHGQVPRSEIANVYQEGVYLSLDVNAACPNAVIEAMSCGIPVVGFNTGALAELVPEGCGRIVEYGNDPWSLEYPDVEALEGAILAVLEDYERYSSNALTHAHREFAIDKVAERYASLILDHGSKSADEG